MFNIMDISGSGLVAERKRMSLIANNIANVNTTRGADGQPYRRQYAVFATLLDREIDGLSPDALREKGVMVDRIVKDFSPFTKVYDPNHPDADTQGYVSLPNVNIVEEMVDLIAASRAYEANIAVMKATKRMMTKAMDVMKI